MPYASEAQRRKFHADPKLHKYINEFEAATHGSLPERVGRPRPHPHKRRLRHHRHSALAQMLAHTRSVHR